MGGPCRRRRVKLVSFYPDLVDCVLQTVFQNRLITLNRPGSLGDTGLIVRVLAATTP